MGERMKQPREDFPARQSEWVVGNNLSEAMLV